MKKLLLMSILSTYVFSSTCPISDGSVWVLNLNRTPNPDTSEYLDPFPTDIIYISNYPVYIDQYYCDTYYFTDGVVTVEVDHVSADGNSFYLRTKNNVTYYKRSSIGCPSGYKENINTHICEETPPIDCDVGSHYDYVSESCVCDTGYSTSYKPDGSLVCDEPQCPLVVDSLPFFKVVDNISNCNFFELSDALAITRPDFKICCYGQESEKNDTCPINNIEINGQCYPIFIQDKNETSDSFTCPRETYWSFEANQCLPFFSDSNTSPTSPSNDPISDNSADINGDGIIDDSELFGGEMTTDEYGQGLEGYTNKLLNQANKLLHSYVLVKLPISVSGSCDAEFSKNITILGRTYTVNLSSWFAKLNEFNSIIYSLVMFIFGLSAVVIVASGRSD